jgi:hypothetical protein
MGDSEARAVADRHRDAGAAQRRSIAALDKDAIQQSRGVDLVGGNPRFAVRRRFDYRSVFAVRIVAEHAAPVGAYPVPEPDRVGKGIQAVAHQHAAARAAAAV